jgi:predicted ATPase
MIENNNNRSNDMNDYSNEFMKITFLKEYMTFKEGQEIEISQGKLNIVVGDNGAGKTTFINIFDKENRIYKQNKYYAIDNMKDQDTIKNTAEGFRKTTSALIDNKREIYLNQLNQQSHGQAWNVELFRLRKKCSDNTFILLDEPETALSVESQIELCKAIIDMKRKYKNFGCLIATHSLLITELIGERVIEIPSGNNIPAQEYLDRKNAVIEESRHYFK